MTSKYRFLGSGRGESVEYEPLGRFSKLSISTKGKRHFYLCRVPSAFASTLLTNFISNHLIVSKLKPKNPPPRGVRGRDFYAQSAPILCKGSKKKLFGKQFFSFFMFFEVWKFDNFILII